MNLNSMLLLGAVMIYLVTVLVYLNGWDKRRRVNSMIHDGRTDPMRLFFYEHMLLDRLHLDPDRTKPVIYAERVLVVITVVFCATLMRGLTVLLFGAILISLFAEDAYQKLIYDSGITNVPAIMNFINYFVPHITSGNSADQSLLGYIEYSRDSDLAEFYEHRDDPEWKLQPHLRQVVDIYDIAKYNEEKGISDYAYILHEISQDYSQKQIYYNSFVARIGEIKPIVLSYYIGCPILIIISFSQTYTFWMGWGGVLVAILTLLMFAAFKFLIYKLQRDTVNTIF